MDVLETTQARPREAETLPEAPFGKKPGTEGRDIEVILMNTAQRSPQKVKEEEFQEKSAKVQKGKKTQQQKPKKPPKQEEQRNHLGLIVSSQPNAPNQIQGQPGNNSPKKPATNKFNWKWDK